MMSLAFNTKLASGYPAEEISQPQFGLIYNSELLLNKLQSVELTRVKKCIRTKCFGVTVRCSAFEITSRIFITELRLF